MSCVWTKKLKNDIVFKTLRVRKKKYKNNHSFSELSDVYLEIGDYLRLFFKDEKFLSNDLMEKIIKKYKKAIEYGKESKYHENCSLAYRALAEIALENGNSEEAITNIETSMKYALKAHNASFIQLCFHQCAYIYSSVPDLIQKAAEIGERGLVYLKENAEQINSDLEAVQTGGDSLRRKAGLQNLLAGIYLDLEDFKNASIHNEIEHSDYELHCRALILKLRLSFGIERLKIANEINQVASKIAGKKCNLKSEAQYYLAIEELRFNHISKSKLLFWQLYCFHMNNLIEDECEMIEKYLIFIFKLEHRLNRVNEELCNLQNNCEIKAQIFEKIADDCVELQLNELSFIFYKKMLKFSTNIEQKRLALLSLAETAQEMKNFTLSAYYFNSLLDVERKLGYSSSKLLETEISIAIVSANISTIPVLDRIQLFEETEKKCLISDDKINLLTDFVEFLEKNPNVYPKNLFHSKILELKNLKHLKELREKNCSIEPTYSQTFLDLNKDENLLTSPYVDNLDSMNKAEIFKQLKDDMKKVEEEQKLEKDKYSRINNAGETRLHIEARSDNYELLKKLIEKGYDVNAVDNGGWTPLSEAVSANKIKNVRLLLEKGAYVDCRSREFLVDKEDEQISGSGQTPLMEACSNGNIPIAKILICFKANIVLTDDDGWGCVDYLRHYCKINELKISSKRFNELENFLKFLENKLKLVGLTPRTSPPLRHKQKILSKCSTLDTRKRKQFFINDNFDEFNDKSLTMLSSSTSKPKITEDEQNLKEYQQTIQSFSRSFGASKDIIVLELDKIQKLPISEADAFDEKILKTNDKNDFLKEAFPADLDFLEVDEDDYDFLIKQTNFDYKIEKINKNNENDIDDILNRRKIRRKSLVNNKFFK